MTTTDIEVYRPRLPAVPTHPPIEVDLRHLGPVEPEPPGAVVFGVAVGGFVALIGGLAAALYYRRVGDGQGVDVGLAVASVAFLTSLLAAFNYQRAKR